MAPKEIIGAGQGPKRCSKKTQAPAPAPAQIPSLRPPPTSTSTSTGTTAAVAGGRPTAGLNKKHVHGAQKSNGQTARAPSSGQPATSASTAASSTKAAVSTSNQPTGQWKQRCLIVISGFMCIGKSSLEAALPAIYKGKEKWEVHDLDSEVHWDRNDKAGLDVYVSKIKKAAGIRYAIVLVSAHEPVRQALLEKGVKFIRVHPALELPESREAKRAFLERENERHKQGRSNERLYGIIDKHWDTWIKNEQKQNGISRGFVIGKDEYLYKVFKREMQGWVDEWKGNGTARYNPRQTATATVPR